MTECPVLTPHDPTAASTSDCAVSSPVTAALGDIATFLPRGKSLPLSPARFRTLIIAAMQSSIHIPPFTRSISSVHRCSATLSIADNGLPTILRSDPLFFTRLGSAGEITSLNPLPLVGFPPTAHPERTRR